MDHFCNSDNSSTRSSLSAPGMRSFGIGAAGSFTCMATLVSSGTVLSYVRLVLCNKRVCNRTPVISLDQLGGVDTPFLGDPCCIAYKE